MSCDVTSHSTRTATGPTTSHYSGRIVMIKCIQQGADQISARVCGTLFLLPAGDYDDSHHLQLDLVPQLLTYGLLLPSLSVNCTTFF